jgi:hypothetical protein
VAAKVCVAKVDRGKLKPITKQKRARVIKGYLGFLRGKLGIMSRKLTKLN